MNVAMKQVNKETGEERMLDVTVDKDDNRPSTTRSTVSLTSNRLSKKTAR